MFGHILRQTTQGYFPIDLVVSDARNIFQIVLVVFKDKQLPGRDFPVSSVNCGGVMPSQFSMHLLVERVKGER